MHTCAYAHARIHVHDHKEKIKNGGAKTTSPRWNPVLVEESPLIDSKGEHMTGGPLVGVLYRTALPNTSNKHMELLGNRYN